MAVSIRRATVADARGIAEVHVRGWQIGFAEFFSAEYLSGISVFLEEESLRRREATLADSEQTTLVAEEDGRILGFASYMLNSDDLGADVGELGAIYVDPEHWDRGIGTALIDAVEAGLTAQGYVRATLWTLGVNQRTRAFYERRGWRFDGATKPHRSGVELVRYAKQLRSGE
jgi:GNAT superfamily N-acetyltransferase